MHYDPISDEGPSIFQPLPSCLCECLSGRVLRRRSWKWNPWKLGWQDERVDWDCLVKQQGVLVVKRYRYNFFPNRTGQRQPGQVQRRAPSACPRQEETRGSGGSVPTLWLRGGIIRWPVVGRILKREKARYYCVSWPLCWHWDALAIKQCTIVAPFIFIRLCFIFADIGKGKVQNKR